MAGADENSRGDSGSVDEEDAGPRFEGQTIFKGDFDSSDREDE